MAASGSLGNLSVDLLLEIAQWTAGLTKAENQAQKFADAIGDRFDRMSANIGGTLKSLAAGFVSAFAADKLLSAVENTVKLADTFDELGQKAGVSTKYIAELSTYAQISGTSIEALTGTMVKFNKALVDAQQNTTGQAAQVFKSLGIEVRNADGSMREAEAVYREAAKALGGMTDGATKTALALFLFGKSGAEAIPTFNALYQSTAEMTAATQKYGETMARLAPVAGQFEETLAISALTGKTLAANVGQQLVPYFNKLVEQWSKANEEGSAFNTIITALVNAFKGIIIAVDAVVTTFADLITIVTTAYKVFTALKGGDMAAARLAFSDGLYEMSKRSKEFEDRVDALINPLAQVTRKMKDTKDASEETAKALAKVKVPDLKFERMEKLTADVSALNAAIAEAGRLTQQVEHQNKLEDKFYSITNAVEKQNEAFGKTAIEAERVTKQHELLLAAIDAGYLGTQRYTDEVERLNKALGDKEALARARNTVNEIEGMWHDAFNSIFDDTRGGWEGLMNSLRNSFKKLLVDYVYNAFAKPLVLNILAQLGGGGGLTQMALSALGGTGGSNTTLGNLLGNFTGFSDFGKLAQEYFPSLFGPEQLAGPGTGESWLGNLMSGQGGGTAWTSNAYGAVGAGVAGVAGGAFGHWATGALGAGPEGQQKGTNYAATGAAIGMQVYGPIGAIAGAVIGTLAGYFSDPEGLAQRHGTFGGAQSMQGQEVQWHGEWQGESALGKFGFTRGFWNGEDMKPAISAFLKGIETMDNALVGFMSPDEIERVKDRLEHASAVYEFGIEHGPVQSLGNIVRDRLEIITREINSNLADFVKGFEGTSDDLTNIVAAFLAARKGAEFDVTTATARQPEAPTMMESYQQGIGALNEYLAGVELSAESLGGLTQQMMGFEAATVQVVQAIDQATDAMHAMFMSTADAIRMSVMTPEEQYKYLQDQADTLFSQLLTETDPAKVQELATKINDDINQAWGLLDESGRQSLAQDYIDRINMVDETVADKMQALRDVVVEDAGTIMQSISDRLADLFAQGAQTADTNQSAANTMQQAADTIAAAAESGAVNGA